MPSALAGNLPGCHSSRSLSSPHLSSLSHLYRCILWQQVAGSGDSRLFVIYHTILAVCNTCAPAAAAEVSHTCAHSTSLSPLLSSGMTIAIVHSGIFSYNLKNLVENTCANFGRKIWFNNWMIKAIVHSRIEKIW